MKVEEMYRDEFTLMDLDTLKKIIDEAHAKAPPGTKVAFRGDEWIPEPIKGVIFATHISTCDSAFLERLTDEQAEKRDRENGNRTWFRLDVPVLLLSNREASEEENAISD